jgi:hypothetical protein
MNVLVPVRFEQPLGVRAVCLIAAYVRPDIVRREQPHRVPERLQLSAPIVRRPAGFQEDGRRRPLGEELDEPIAREPAFLINSPWLARDGDLKDRLRDIDGDGRMLHVDSSLPWPHEAVSPLAQ